MKKLVRLLLKIGSALYFWLTCGCSKQMVERVQTLTHNQIDTVFVRDTLNPSYLEPTDSQLVYLVFDTVSGFQLDSIVITDLNSNISRSYQPEFFLESYVFHPLTPMICKIDFYYEWIEPTPPTFAPIISMYSFTYDHSWTVQVPNKSPHDGIHQTVAMFSPIDIKDIFTIKFQNHAD